jgi:aspartate/methionine/tyrosine aminotransferase
MNRPLFHGSCKAPSLSQHSYTKVVVTSSMSKVWCMSGVRNGWIICRDETIRNTILNAREYTLQSTSILDEIIATEALSDRCRPAILAKLLDNAKQGLELWDAFVKKNSNVCSWTRPVAAATGFLKFHDVDGKPWDELQLCTEALKDQGVLLAPGSLSFGEGDAAQDLRGYVRVQLTLPAPYLQEGLKLLQVFLDRKTELPN